MIDPFKAEEIELSGMPSGEHEFELTLSTKGSIWRRYKDWVYFPNKLEKVPSQIVFEQVAFEGMADLYVHKITKKGFMFSIVVTGSNPTTGTNIVHFDWEAVE